MIKSPTHAVDCIHSCDGRQRSARCIVFVHAVGLQGCATEPVRHPAARNARRTGGRAGYARRCALLGRRSFRGISRLAGSCPRTKLGVCCAGLMDRSHNYLVISSGGVDGAFGAGLLVGWTAAGTRPEFQVVTGVSAGAMIAPFAFPGARVRRRSPRDLYRASRRRTWSSVVACSQALRRRFGDGHGAASPPDRPVPRRRVRLRRSQPRAARAGSS